MEEDSPEAYKEYSSQIRTLSSVICSVNGTGHLNPNMSRAGSFIEPVTQWRTSDYVPLANLGEVYDMLKKRGENPNGEILGVFIDEYGQQIKLRPNIPHKPDPQADPVTSAFFQIDLRTLQQTNIRGNTWIVASRDYHAEAAYCAIKGNLANSLVIDQEIAFALLEYSSKEY
jgi:DNA-binding transcriptional regulator LsrR (DeoR family)